MRIGQKILWKRKEDFDQFPNNNNDLFTHYVCVWGGGFENVQIWKTEFLEDDFIHSWIIRQR